MVYMSCAKLLSLVPTRMGMILKGYKGFNPDMTCPHTHGDDPQVLPLGTALAELVPTRVGMILL